MNRHWLNITGVSLLVLLVFAVGVVVGSRTTAPNASAAPQTTEPEANAEAGIVIVAVDPDSPAAKAGVKRGDILLSIDDTAVNTHSDLSRALSDHQAGDEVKLTLTHGDESRTLTATLVDQNGRAYLGVKTCGCLFDFEAHLPKAPAGATIVEVVADGPADKAGLKAGDRIVAVDGVELGFDKDLADVIQSHKPGDSVTLTIERPGEEAREVTVTLGEHPDSKDKAYLGLKYAPGVRAFAGRLPNLDRLPFGRELPFPRFDLPEGVTRGAIVGSVVADSPAAKAGLTEGDVITAVDGKSIEQPQDLIDAVAAHKPGDALKLTVHRSGESESIEITATLAGHPDTAGKAYLGVTVGGFFIQQFENGEMPQGFPFDSFPFRINPPQIEPNPSVGDQA